MRPLIDASGPGGDRPLIRLRRGVGRVRRARGETVLVAADTGTAVRISEVGNGLVPLLLQGTSADALAQHLETFYPRAGDAARKLGVFLGQLESSGLIETEARPPRPARTRRIELCRPDPLAKRIVNVLSRVPAWLSWAVLSILFLAAVAGVVVVLAGPLRPHPSDAVRKFDALGVAIFALLVVPIHELSHAVACRAAGAEVKGAGLVLHGRVVPGPYVDTSLAYRVADRWRRFWIPAAGPLVDLLAAGAAGWVFAASHSASALYVFILSLAFVYLDTTPLTASDGSRMLEAVFEDELARRAALSRYRSAFSSWQIVAAYRTACVLHVALGAAFLLGLAR